MITIKNESDSQKLMKELDDILHYEFKKWAFDQKENYDFSKELEKFLERFLDINPYHDYEFSLTNPKIYTKDGERTFRFTCTNLKTNMPYIFYINYYIGMNEVTVKDVINETIRKYIVGYNMTYNPSSISIHPYDADKKFVEILEEPGKYTINYQNDNDQIIKVILAGSGINEILKLYNFKRFIQKIEFNNNINWDYILDYFKDMNEYIKNKLSTYEMKAMEASYDEGRNYFFNYLQIKDGKIVRLEHKVNDLVTTLDENSIWHYSDDNVQIDADDNLNETVRFKSGINKRILGRKITRGEQSIKRVRDTLTQIIK